MNNETVFFRLHHASLLVQDLQNSLYFYCKIIGLTENHQRPEMGFKGAWLEVGDQQIHLLNLPQSEPLLNKSASGESAKKVPEHVGRDRHVAIHVSEIEAIQKKLEENNIPYTMSMSGRQALFCRDPDNNGLEFIKIQNGN